MALSLPNIQPRNLQRNGPSQYNKNFDFTYPQTNSFYTVTSVSGHMLEHDFSETHRKWHSCDPFELFDAPIETRVKQVRLQAPLPDQVVLISRSNE